MGQFGVAGIACRGGCRSEAVAIGPSDCAERRQSLLCRCTDEGCVGVGGGGRSLSGFVGNNSRPRLPIESRNLPRLRSTAGQRMKQAACPEWTGQAALHWIRANSFRRLQAGERTSLHSGREKRRDRSITWSHRDIPEIRKPELRPQRDTASAINRSHLNQSIHSTPLLFPSQIRREQGMVRTNSVCG